MKNLVFNSPAAELAGEAMDANSVALVTDNWLVREAGTVNRSPWHHDNPYFIVSDDWCVLWMGFEPVREGEGVVFLNGSHKWGRKFMPLSFAGTRQKVALQEPYEPTPDFTENLAENNVLEFDPDPGDCLIFDSHTLHGAPKPRTA